MRCVHLLISVVAGAALLAGASGGAVTTPPTAPGAAPLTKEAHAELARAQLEQGLVRAERTALLLTELERLAPTPAPPEAEAGP